MRVNANARATRSVIADSSRVLYCPVGGRNRRLNRDKCKQASRWSVRQDSTKPLRSRPGQYCSKRLGMLVLLENPTKITSAIISLDRRSKNVYRARRSTFRRNDYATDTNRRVVSYRRHLSLKFSSKRPSTSALFLHSRVAIDAVNGRGAGRNLGSPGLRVSNVEFLQSRQSLLQRLERLGR